MDVAASAGVGAADLSKVTQASELAVVVGVGVGARVGEVKGVADARLVVGEPCLVAGVLEVEVVGVIEDVDRDVGEGDEDGGLGARRQVRVAAEVGVGEFHGAVVTRVREDGRVGIASDAERAGDE